MRESARRGGAVFPPLPLPRYIFPGSRHGEGQFPTGGVQRPRATPAGRNPARCCSIPRRLEKSRRGIDYGPRDSFVELASPGVEPYSRTHSSLTRGYSLSKIAGGGATPHQPILGSRPPFRRSLARAPTPTPMLPRSLALSPYLLSLYEAPPPAISPPHSLSFAVPNSTPLSHTHTLVQNALVPRAGKPDLRAAGCFCALHPCWRARTEATGDGSRLKDRRGRSNRLRAEGGTQVSEGLSCLARLRTLDLRCDGSPGARPAARRAAGPRPVRSQ